MTHEESNTVGESNTNPTAVPRRYEWTAFGRPSTAIVESVADATGRDPADVAPPERYVDSETLDALVASGGDGDGADISVSFALDCAEVTLDSDGMLEVRPVGAECDRDASRPRSDPELNARLGELLDVAFESGVDVLGGWEIRNGPGVPDWDVHVTELSKPPESGELAVREDDCSE